jgi:hypothetical protein
MTKNDLEEACTTFEAEHGVDAFLEAMAKIIQARLAAHRVNIEFDEADDEGEDDGRRKEGGGDHRSIQRYR